MTIARFGLNRFDSRSEDAFASDVRRAEQPRPGRGDLRLGLQRIRKEARSRRARSSPRQDRGHRPQPGRVADAPHGHRQRRALLARRPVCESRPQASSIRPRSHISEAGSGLRFFSDPESPRPRRLTQRGPWRYARCWRQERGHEHEPTIDPRRRARWSRRRGLRDQSRRRAGSVNSSFARSLADKIETRIGTLEFKDGAPTVETAEKVYDTLDFTRALNVYNNSFRGASALGDRQGLREHRRRATTTSSSSPS